MTEYDLMLRNASVQGQVEPVDVAVSDGRIAALGANLPGRAGREINAEGRLLLPGFVEAHTHLDIALMNPMDRPGRIEPYLSQRSMLDAMTQRRKAFTHADIVQRASRALDMAVQHGVTALRAQCQMDVEIGLKHFHALQEVKEKYADRLTLQLVAYPDLGLFSKGPQSVEVIRQAFREGAEVMGGSVNHDVVIDPAFDYRVRHIDLAFDLAMEHNVDLDFHADLSLPDQAGLDDLEVVIIARKAIERGYQGRVSVGHLSALDSMQPDDQQKVIQLIKEAGLNAATLPDLYRLGRMDTHHVRRGLTRVKELLAAGVNVSLAMNNVRDALRPVGNFNPLEEALILTYGAHMDQVDQMETVMQMITVNPARALKLPDYGLQPGCYADMLVVDAPTPSAAIVDQAAARWVFKRGRLVAETRVERVLY